MKYLFFIHPVWEIIFNFGIYPIDYILHEETIVY